jgi:hypothetical protein
MGVLAGDSREQKEAEKWLIEALSKKLGLSLSKKKFCLSEGQTVEVDAFCESPFTLSEISAHMGKPRPGNVRKIMTDAFKMIFIDSLFHDGKGRKILLFVDQEAAALFQKKSWEAECLKYHGIEIEIIELPREMKEKVINAQKRQVR